jgi:hypothetical protein
LHVLQEIQKKNPSHLSVAYANCRPD